MKRTLFFSIHITMANIPSTISRAPLFLAVHDYRISHVMLQFTFILQLKHFHNYKQHVININHKQLGLNIFKCSEYKQTGWSEQDIQLKQSIAAGFAVSKQHEHCSQWHEQKHVVETHFHECHVGLFRQATYKPINVNYFRIHFTRSLESETATSETQ